MKRFGKLSAIVPGYNEEELIYKNLIEIANELEQLCEDYEVIFVNDGSKDNTLKHAIDASTICEKIKIVDYKKNHGKGNALKEGVSFATGEYIAFIDADLDLHPSQLAGFFDIMDNNNADAVIGSKMHPDSELFYPKSRKIISTGYYIFLLLLFRLNVRDTQTGLKLFKAEALKPVMEKILAKRFAYDIEVLAVLNRKGKRIIDAPIKLVFTRGQSWNRIRFSDFWNTFVDTLAIFYRLYILKYYDDPK